MENDDTAQAVLSFWFGDLTADGWCSREAASKWWKKDPDFDRHVRDRFGELHSALAAPTARADRPDWFGTKDGLVATIVVLDQFSRNMFRNSASMFASDDKARTLALEFVSLGWDREAPPAHAVFSYMPLMHSEDLSDQERSVALFSNLVERAPDSLEETIAKNLDFARQHRDIVARFGRFPHRNALLGRVSTQEELAFLEQPGSSF